MPKILREFSHVVFIVVFACNAPEVLAQRIEVGATIGCANYVGDVSPSLVLKETKPAIGFFGRYNFSSSFAFTGSLLVTQIEGSDQNFAFNAPRNLSFRSNITEVSGVFEFNYLKYALGVRDQNFTSYLFLGLGMFSYNPQANYDGSWIDLRPIRTENKSYSTVSLAVPFGIGIKWRMSRHLALESSIGFRKTYTDYLDDVSSTYADPVQKAQTMGTAAGVLTDRSSEINNGTPQFKPGYRRGNADFNDWYIIGGISLSVRIFDRQKCARFY
jgi:hypothetical protein